MEPRADAIPEFDLEAYVEDQLPPARRIEVEAYLSGNPEAAMRMMADLRIRDELRLALADVPRTVRIGTADAARRLERGLGRGHLLSRLRGVAAAALLVGLGWIAHAGLGPLGVSASAVPPGYVEDALRAHRTALLRADMASRAGPSGYDPAEIRAATAITLPELPRGWSVVDTQIVPEVYGPSVELTLRGNDLGTVSLFAARPGSFDVVPATLVHDGDLNAAYWQMGEVAYALVAATGTRDLEGAASRLARALR